MIKLRAQIRHLDAQMQPTLWVPPVEAGSHSGLRVRSPALQLGALKTLRP